MLVLCNSCKTNIDEVTADNFWQVLKEVDYSADVNFEKYSGIPSCFIDIGLSINPKQSYKIEDIGKSVITTQGYESREKGYYTLEHTDGDFGDKTSHALKNHLSIGLRDNRNGDFYGYSYTKKDPSILSTYERYYNLNDPKSEKRFRENLNCALTENSAVYKKATLKNGHDIIIREIGDDYFLIGEIFKVNDDATYSVNFHIFEKSKKLFD